MEYEIVNQYADALLLKKPLCQVPFGMGNLIDQLTDSIRRVFPREESKNRHNCGLLAVKLFQHFLESHGTSSITPHETTLEDFRSWLETRVKKKTRKPYTSEEASDVVDCVRRLFNEDLYGRGLIQRKLLRRKAYLKYKRFFSLSETTQQILIQYEKDGRCVVMAKKYFEDSEGRERFKYKVTLKPKSLTPYDRKHRIENVLTILSQLNKTGIEQIETPDIERLIDIYRKKNRKETAIDYLVVLSSVIGNALDKCLLKKNPFDNVTLEKCQRRTRKDFILPDEIAKLLDLQSLDWDDPKEVRAQLMTILLYDTGLRASALFMLKLEDVAELPDGTFRLIVRGGYLKGTKGDRDFYMLFHQTIRLLRHWIHVSRQKLKPETNHLFVSLNGEPLTRSGIGDIVFDCCRRCGARTSKNALPTPHVFRHTLPTLNTAPFGKCVASRLMQQRLGHADFETFEKVYVHDNPLAEMKEYKKLYAKGMADGHINEEKKEEFFRILDSLVFVRTSSILNVKKAYERQMKVAVKGHDDRRLDDILTEDQAVAVLANFQIDYRPLRSWSLKEGICLIEAIRGQRRYIYEKLSILRLAEKYITFKEARKAYSGSRTQFHRKIQQCQRIMIGRKMLILKKDLFEFLVRGYSNNVKFTDVGAKHTDAMAWDELQLKSGTNCNREGHNKAFFEL